MVKTNSKKSLVWDYFEHFPEIQSAKCNICSVFIKCKDTSTSGLRRHLQRTEHPFYPSLPLIKKEQETKIKNDSSSSDDDESANDPLQFETFAEELSEVPSKKIKKEAISTKKKPAKVAYKKARRTLSEWCSMLAAVDGIPINTIVKSEFIRSSLGMQGLQLSSCPMFVMNSLITDQYGKCRKEYIQQITEHLQSGNRLSIVLNSFDVSSDAMGYYLGVTVRSHKNLCWNLGTIRTNKEAKSPRDLLNGIDVKLSEYKINLKTNCVAVVTDHSNEIKDVGKLLGIEQQRCYAHGIQLGICDVLYKINDNNDDNVSSENYNYNNEGADEFETSLNYSICSPKYRVELNNFDFQQNIDIPVLIAKVRKIITFFRESPLRNEILQKYVKIEYSKELELKIDKRQKWSSLLEMLERFTALQSNMQKALHDINPQHVEIISEFDISVINVIIGALQPIKIAIERITRIDASLLTAEIVYRFVLEELEGQDTFFSRHLRTAICNRVVKSRNCNLLDLLEYLQSPTAAQTRHNTDGINFDEKFYKVVCQTNANALYDRLYNKKVENINLCQMKQEATHSHALSLYDKLNAAIDNVMGSSDDQAETEIYEAAQSKHSSSQQRSLSNDFLTYDLTKKRSPTLNLVLDALAGIPPAAIETECAYTSQLKQSFNTTLKADSINKLWFLKHYYKNN